MIHLGLGGEADEYWRLSEAIDSAHRMAGFHIRDLLLERVQRSDLTELEATGRMDFELDEADGGTLTALRVLDISAETYSVPPNRIGHPFRTLDDELWPG
jgi:hypothetical protein